MLTFLPPGAWRLIAAFAWSIATFAAPVLAQTASSPAPTLPRIELQAGVHLIRAEVAADSASRARGLMFRDSLGPNQGMIFVFEESARQCFWMRNTRIPLSAAFIDESGRIVNIADMQPLDERSHCSVRPVRYALEVNQGWFAKRGISAGFKLRGPPFGR